MIEYYTTIGGKVRYLGLRPTDPEIRSIFKSAADVVPDVPQSKWNDITSWHYIKAPVDQNGQGSCVGASGVSAMMIARARQGLPHVELSIASLYGQINDGRDAGASLGDALIALEEVGCCPTATIDRYDWRKARTTTAWREEAKLYRLDESYSCTAKEFLSALQLGFCGQFGVNANSTFEPDANGWMPANRGGINHAVTGTGMKQNQATGKWYIEMLNSWGPWGWNNSGIGYFPVDSLQEDELWIIRTTTVPSTTIIA